MIRKIAAPLLFLLIGCIVFPGAAWSGSPKVEFSREGDLKLKARKATAKPTELTFDDLLSQDYIQLGTMRVVQDVETCKIKKDGNTDCKKEKRIEDVTRVLLEKAAKKGADLVWIREDKNSDSRSTFVRFCTSTMRVPEYYCPPVGGANCYTVYGSQCASYETNTTGFIRTQTSSGDLYSYEPALAEGQKLTRAVTNGNLEVLKNALEGGFSVNAGILQGRTALGAAAAAGRTEIVRYLLSKGASVDHGDDLGITPLMLAAKASRTETAKLLLDNGADRNARQKGKGETKGYTPLMFAVQFGDSSIVRVILAAGPDTDLKNGQGKSAEELAITVEKASDMFSSGEKYGLMMAYTKGAFGFIDKTGKNVIPPQFDDVRRFQDGLVAVKVGSAWGFIDRKGVMVIEPQFESRKTYSYPGPFSEGLAAFPGDDGWGYVDTEGQMIIAPFLAKKKDMFSKGRPFSNGVARISDGLAKYFFIDREGRRLTDHWFISGYDFTEGLAAVTLIGLAGAGYIYSTGKFAIEAKFKSTLPFSEGLAAVRVGGMWGFIDVNEKMIIPPQFPDDKDDHGDSPKPFSEGLAAVKIDGKWGFVDRAGKMVVKPRYAEVGSFRDGRAQVVHYKKFGFSRDRTFGFVDRNGIEVIPIQYEDAGDFSDGLAAVKLDGKFGYINPAGDFVIRPLFSTGMEFAEGLVGVRITRDTLAILE